MTPWVLRLIVANVAMFVVSYAAPQIVGPLLLMPALIPYRPWTPITYMFLHAGLGHIFFNMLALYFFGPRVEMRLGGGHFLGLYFVSGLAGAALSFITPYARIVGASGAIFGVLMAFALYWPREKIYIWALVGIEARWFVLIMTALSLFGGFGGVGGIAHFAHLGGFAGGFLYLKWLERHSPARKFKKKVGVEARPKRPARSDLQRWSHIPRDRMHPVNRAELDRVMAKLEEEGVDSLTPEERAFLDRFSAH